MLTVGKNEKTLLERAQMQHMPIPTQILNAPELENGLGYYMTVFNMLTGSRPSSDGFVARIPYQTILLYCQENGITGDAREDMFYLIHELDVCFVNHMFEEMKKKMPKPPPKPKT